MAEPYVVTIARGFGSGGKEIGTKLAEKLGIPVYERQILRLASDESGLNEALFGMVDEKLTGITLIKKLRGIPFHTVAEPQDAAFISDVNLYNLQSMIIRNLARSESCVIIGKCADYVLRDYPNVASFYIEAPRADCVRSIVGKLGVTEKEARRLIQKTDKYRADYYKYYTNGGEWTSVINYDMTLNSARVGRDRCVEVLEHYARVKFNL
ncbi:MAG: cytidylate kinase-like family protein [Oscillospiraceae bacterium]|jgi:cytidylate kinase|nr:cytidylate kinase-like family protein [Oscillospiraceae bacterium]